MTRIFTSTLLAAFLLLAGCGHDHADGRSADDALARPAAAGPNAHGQSHDDEHDEAHAAGHGGKHEAGHGHGGGIAVTHFSAVTELFVEYEPLVVGRASAFAAHLTWLGERFRAVDEGRLVVSLDGGAAGQRAEATVSATPGIFRPELVPDAAGRRRLRLTLHANGQVIEHDLGEVEVHPDDRAADAAPGADDEDGGGIGFTKEQQWKIDFAHAPVAPREFRESVAANAVLRPAADREALIVSPAAGQLDPSAPGFPSIGKAVAEGEVLLTVRPRLATGVDLATLEADLARARLRVEHAARTATRLRALAAAEAIAPARAIEAAHEESLASAELRAAERRLGAARGERGGIPLRSPVAGTVVDVRTTRGAAVLEGQTLLHVADLRKLWLEAHVPESELQRITAPTGAFVEAAGSEPTLVLEVGANARLVAFGGLVDEATRTVPAIFEFDNPQGSLRAGQRLQVRVFSGATSNRPAVPASAIVDDGGQQIVFVLLDGESFARRPIVAGLRDGDWVAIESGLSAGERVVTAGAWQVHLAAAAPAAMGHGHAH
jgi:cobalt-zinc-cadmium efflux system membrane fusion protein